MNATPAWVHIEEHPCVTVRCTDCNEGYGEDGALHFATVAEAEDALSDGGWEVVDGDALCVGCADDRLCAELGHSWRLEGAHRLAPDGFWRCTRCCQTANTDPRKDAS